MIRQIVVLHGEVAKYSANLHFFSVVFSSGELLLGTLLPFRQSARTRCASQHVYHRLPARTRLPKGGARISYATQALYRLLPARTLANSGHDQMSAGRMGRYER